MIMSSPPSSASRPSSASPPLQPPLSIGFIMLRHVNSKKTNLYWQKCYDSIRLFYAENLIVIIDDNSMQEFLTSKEMTNVIHLQSEYPARGELLPYIYFLRHKWFDNAVIIHDSVFVNGAINFHVPHYRRLWSFQHTWDNEVEEQEMIDVFKNPSLTRFFKTKRWWKGCFGCMTSIRQRYLEYVNKNFNLELLLPIITSRAKRMCFERVLACILDFCYQRVDNEQVVTTSPIFGDIHQYCPWGITFENMHAYKRLPLIKTWTGR